MGELKSQNEKLRQNVMNLQSAQIKKEKITMPRIAVNTLKPPKSIRISKSLQKLKIKQKREQSAKRKAAPQINAYCSYNSHSHSHSHSSSANAFIERLSELEGVNEDIEQQRTECRGCGRKFIESALKKHAKICQKVFQSKRKKFEIVRVGKEAKSAQGFGSNECKKKKR